MVVQVAQAQPVERTENCFPPGVLLDSQFRCRGPPTKPNPTEYTKCVQYRNPSARTVKQGNVSILLESGVCTISSPDARAPKQQIRKRKHPKCWGTMFPFSDNVGSGGSLLCRAAPHALGLHSTALFPLHEVVSRCNGPFCLTIKRAEEKGRRGPSPAAHRYPLSTPLRPRDFPFTSFAGPFFSLYFTPSRRERGCHFIPIYILAHRRTGSDTLRLLGSFDNSFKKETTRKVAARWRKNNGLKKRTNSEEPLRALA